MINNTPFLRSIVQVLVGLRRQDVCGKGAAALTPAFSHDRRFSRSAGFVSSAAQASGELADKLEEKINQIGQRMRISRNR
ncbi:unnamed protein product [Ixodes persulcatus]